MVTEMDVNGLSVDEVNDIDTFRLLKDSWSELLQQSPDNDIFLTWEWLYYWWKYYGNDKKLRILLIKEGDKLVGIAPFMQSKYKTGPLSVDVLENICSINCDRSGIIYSPDNRKVIPVFLEYLTQLMDKEKLLIRISQVSDESSFAASLRRLPPEFVDSLVTKERVISICPYIILPETWEEYQSHCYPNKKRLRNLRRLVKVLEKEHAVEFKEYSGGDEELNNQLQIMYELHKNRWINKTGESKFTESYVRDFYFEISKIFYQYGWLAFTSLNVDGKPASILWGFRYKNAWLAMTAAFDPGYSQYSIGQLHYLKIIEKAIQEHLEKFDFLKGGSEYKHHWTSSLIKNIQFTITGNNMLARFRSILLDIIIKLQNIRQRTFSENVVLLYRRLRYFRKQRVVEN
jgi:hypothetical protein